MVDIFNLNLIELEDILIKEGFKKYRATQIFDFLYKKRVTSFFDMTNISNELIQYLNDNYYIGYLKARTILEDENKNKKVLFELSDGACIESVLLNNEYGYSICVSSQVGCNMGCSFCASGQKKKVRDLTCGELVSQIMSMEKLTNISIKNVVIMGIGEPFDNYDNVIKFCKNINDPKILEIGIRHITLSTCGIIPKIREFSKLDMQVNLAISLHASNDLLRSKLMKINHAYPFKELIKTIDNYVKTTKRRVTIEYILIDGVNDKIENAHELIKIFKSMNIYINLIIYNSVDGVSYKPSKKENADLFFKTLRENGLDVITRKSGGDKINAACGQLRSRSL